MQITRFLFLLAIGFILTSCVSQRKYNDLLASKGRSDMEVSRLTEVEKEHQATMSELDATYASLAEREATLAELRDKHKKLEAVEAELKRQYDVLAENNRNLLATSSDEKKELTAQLTAKQKELDDKARTLNQLKEDLEVKEAAIAEREENIAALKAQLDAQRQSIQSLKKGLNEALRGFSASDLTVVEKNGRIYVSMSQNLLFASGSDIVDKKGKEALATLATVLNVNPDIEIMVEGHTDTDGTAAFNWDLSVSRATAVVKELTSHQVEPKRITAAGRSFFWPLDTNDTDLGKARNRRTEIILSPKFEELYKLLN